MGSRFLFPCSSRGDAVSEVVEKVVAVITRERPAGRELLVFTEGHLGRQLPAGTVEPGEPLQEALFREVQEESGLTAVRLVRKLAELPLELPFDEVMISAKVAALAEPRVGALELPYLVRRGMAFHCLAERDGFAQIALGPAASGTEDSPSCWVSLQAVTRRVRRHVYWLMPTEETATTWVVTGPEEDPDISFTLEWVPLRDARLVPVQDAWLQAGLPAMD